VAKLKKITFVLHGTEKFLYLFSRAMKKSGFMASPRPLPVILPTTGKHIIPNHHHTEHGKAQDHCFPHNLHPI
jgi:hypothetical protein